MKLHPIEQETIRRMDLMLKRINSPFYYSPPSEEDGDLGMDQEEEEEEFYGK